MTGGTRSGPRGAAELDAAARIASREASDALRDREGFAEAYVKAKLDLREEIGDTPCS